MLFDMSMNMEPVADWTATDLLMLFIMWAVMMAGMMLPSAVPVILLIERVTQQRIASHQAYTPTIVFTFGYILAWCFYSVLITLLQYGLHQIDLLTPMMNSAYQSFSALILIAAGVYQFSSFKQNCLKLCRSPFSILNSHWQGSIKGAIMLGLKQGSYCVGCCWLLMMILFVSGVMNIKWILILTLVVIIEKLAPSGSAELISKFLGAALIIFGLSYWW
ncbi:DUF2182 domain-containing protein [Pseudoalteromonas byunsanensis]